MKPGGRVGKMGDVDRLAPPYKNQNADRLGLQWWVRALNRTESGADAPAWRTVVEEAVAAACESPAGLPAGSWQDTFAVPMRPFRMVAQQRLIAGVGRHLAPETADLDTLADSFGEDLARLLARIVARSLVRELTDARERGELVGADGEQRFTNFIGRLSTGLVDTFDRYPVLARLLGTASQHATDAAVEMLTRFAADRAAIVDTLLGGVDPGPIVTIRPGLGDRHGRGRTVTAVSFADGRQVVYRPRSAQALLRFGEVVDWLNERVPAADLRPAAILARPGYGWVEFVAHRPLSRTGQAGDFYRRLGVLLVALYALRAVDIHCENVIADGDQPVLVDVETLFHPTLPTAPTVAADPAAARLGASVRRTGLLPYLQVGPFGTLDYSGMGGDAGETCPNGVLDWAPPATDTTRLVLRAGPFAGALNRPYRQAPGGDVVIEPADHEEAVLAGFRQAYDAIVRDRAEFKRLLLTCADCDVRVVVRHTADYAQLLDEATDPDLLGDPDAWTAALAGPLEAAGDGPLSHLPARHEIADLLAGDIPLLTGRPHTRDVRASTGERIPALLDRPGLEDVLKTVEAMSEIDRGDQEWIISVSLASRRPAAGHLSGEVLAHPVTAVEAEPARLLAAACGLADQIVARGASDPSGADPRINWNGLQLVDDKRWMVLPMGAGLADGYTGVALFLAQLAALTGIDRYAEVARRATSPIPKLLAALAGRSELLAAIGCGGVSGLGGIAYGLARLSTLLDDADHREWSETAVGLAAAATGESAPPGWAAGTAGCLTAMTAIRAETGSTAAARLADECADRLAELMERTEYRCVEDGAPVPAGFAAGPAGIGWALTETKGAHVEAGMRAIRRATAPAVGDDDSYGWCTGAAGLLVAATRRPDDSTGRAALELLTNRPVLGDLSLCHGELGVAEALIVLTAQSPAARRVRRHRAGLVLAALNRTSAWCGTPGGVTTPGLFSGLAGIGYGLLRLAFTERVPSVLLLEPTPRPHPRTLPE